MDADKVAAALNGFDAMTLFGRTKFATEANQHGLQIGHTMVIAQWQKQGREAVQASGLAAGQQEREPGLPDPLNQPASGKRLCNKPPAAGQFLHTR